MTTQVHMTVDVLLRVQGSDTEPTLVGTLNLPVTVDGVQQLVDLKNDLRNAVATLCDTSKAVR